LKSKKYVYGICIVTSLSLGITGFIWGIRGNLVTDLSVLSFLFCVACIFHFGNLAEKAYKQLQKETGEAKEIKGK
jgi:hypothetical protein